MVGGGYGWPYNSSRWWDSGYVLLAAPQYKGKQGSGNNNNQPRIGGVDDYWGSREPLLRWFGGHRPCLLMVELAGSNNNCR